MCTHAHTLAHMPGRMLSCTYEHAQMHSIHTAPDTDAGADAPGLICVEERNHQVHTEEHTPVHWPAGRCTTEQTQTRMHHTEQTRMQPPLQTQALELSYSTHRSTFATCWLTPPRSRSSRSCTRGRGAAATSRRWRPHGARATLSCVIQIRHRWAPRPSAVSP